MKVKYIIKDISNIICNLLDNKISKGNKLKDRIKVAFLVQYIPAWNKFDSIYLELSKNRNFDVSIICIPEDINNYKFYMGGVR